MNLETIRKLELRRGYPAISILLPTHRTHPDNKQDPILLKNLVREAEERLAQEDSKRNLKPIVDSLQKLADDVDHEHNLDGLALFVSEDFSMKEQLPFSVRPRVQIDETFAVRDLVYAYNRCPRYWTIVFGEHATRVFHCIRDLFEVAKIGEFPMEFSGPNVTNRLSKSTGVDVSESHLAHRREFARAVDNQFAAVLKTEDLPFVIAGTEQFVSDFMSMTQHESGLIATISGDYSEMSPHELPALIWPDAKAAFVRLRSHAIEELDAGVGAGKYASGISQAWTAADQGKVGLLLVEEDYNQAAILVEGAFPEIVDDPADPRAQDDLVDAAIQRTLAIGGRVAFADPGTLAVHERIAAVLRY